MKWSFRIQHKFKTALLFLVVVLVILGCSFLENRYMSQINISFASMYKDRLIPEAELFHINDNMHSRRLILEKYLLSPDKYDRTEVAKSLALHGSKIDSIIASYETTFLVAEEGKMLAKLKGGLQNYRKLEQAYFAPEAQNLPAAAYQDRLEPVFSQVRSELLTLSTIQTTVGQELYQGSEVMKGSASSVSYLQIVVVLVIALAVQALLLNSRPVLPKKIQKFHLN